MGEEGEDVGTSGGFLGGCYAVFEVVGYRVYCETAGFLEEFGGGGGDFFVSLAGKEGNWVVSEVP